MTSTPDSGPQPAHSGRLLSLQRTILICAILIPAASQSGFGQTELTTDALTGTEAEVKTELSTSPVIRVEEDWKLVVREPDAERGLPQFVNVISPIGSVGIRFGVFELNCRSEPDYAAGGLQIQSWFGNSLTHQHNSPKQATLFKPGEVIEYTVAMYLQDGKLQYEIINGESETWGSFGGQGYLKITENTRLTNLALYDPSISLANSRLLGGAHRMECAHLKAVRRFRADGTSTTEAKQIDLHSYHDNIVEKTYDEFQMTESTKTLDATNLETNQTFDADVKLAPY